MTHKNIGCYLIYYLIRPSYHCTKNELSIKNFFSKCDQIRRKLRIWSHLLKKSSVENFIFCAVYASEWFLQSLLTTCAFCYNYEIDIFSCNYALCLLVFTFFLIKFYPCLLCLGYALTRFRQIFKFSKQMLLFKVYLSLS